MSVFARTLISTTALLGMVILLGCSSERHFPTGQVTGKITYKGQPVPGGTIMFISTSEAGDFGGGAIKEDGTYDVPKAPAGTCKIQMQVKTGGSPAIPPQQLAMMKREIQKAKEAGVKVPEDLKLDGTKKKATFDFPRKYSDVSSSGLTMEVTTGTQEKNWELQ
jgi:hypothetical protein